MPTTYPTFGGIPITRSNYAPNLRGNTGLLLGIIKLQRTLFRRRWLAYVVAGTNVTGTTYGTVLTMTLEVPSWALGLTLNIEMQARCDTTAKTGNFRLKDSGSGNVGSAVSVPFNAALQLSGPASLAIVDAWCGTKRTILIEGNTGSASGEKLYIENTANLNAWLSD